MGWVQIYGVSFCESAPLSICNLLSKVVMQRNILEREISNLSFNINPFSSSPIIGLEYSNQLFSRKYDREVPGNLKFRLNKSVGKNGVNLPDDVLTVKNRLVELGYYISDKTNKIDTSTINAIKLFQSIIAGKAKTIGDGRINVNGNTHLWLNAVNAPKWVELENGSKSKPNLYGFYNYTKLEQKDGYHYGTNWLTDTIYAAARAYTAFHLQKNANASIIQINDMTSSKGGDQSDHSGHETGLNADIRVPKKNGTSGIPYTDKKNYDQTTAEAMLTAFLCIGNIKLIYFNDPVLIKKRLCIPMKGHNDHFHIHISPQKLGQLLTV